MNIRRSTRPNTYTNIDNDLINDTRLSAAALGVLIYLLSKPNNWTANKKQLQKRFTTDRNKLSMNGLDNCFKEMRDAGFAELKARAEKGEDGRLYFKGSEYVIFDKTSKKVEDITESEDLRDSDNSPSPEDLPTSDISEAPTNSESLITTDLNITTKEVKEIKGDKETLSITAPNLFSQFKEVLAYLTEKSGNRFRLGEKSKVVKSDKYKKITARLKEYSFEDIKAVIDVKCKEWGDSAEWCKYLVPKTLFSASNFEKYLDQAENVGNKLKAKDPNQINEAGQKTMFNLFCKHYRQIYEKRYIAKMSYDMAIAKVEKEIQDLQPSKSDTYTSIMVGLKNTSPNLYSKAYNDYKKL